MAIFGPEDLHDYQGRSIDRAVEYDRTILVIPVGGGKSVVALTAIKELLDTKAFDTFWVFAPKRVARNVWPVEPARWRHLHGLKVSVVTGTEKQRIAALEADADVYVVNFENIPWLYERIGRFGPRDAVVIDELSKLKNPQGVRAKALIKMIESTEYRLGMTATPRPKDRLDLFTPMKVIHGPALWGSSFYAWRKSYFEQIDYLGYDWAPRAGHDVLIDEQFAKRATIVTKEEMKQAVIEPVLLTEQVDLPLAVRIAHDDAMRKWILRLPVEELLGSAAIGSMKARQISSGTVLDGAGNPHVLHKVRLEIVEDIIETANEPTIVVYQFLSEVAAMHTLWPEMPVIGDGVSDRDSDRIIDDWNAGRVPVLALHSAAGGHGLNLQYGGRRMIFYTLPWPLDDYEQPIGRIARQGQEDVVYVHHLLAPGSIDEVMMARLQERDQGQEALRTLIARLRNL